MSACSEAFGGMEQIGAATVFFLLGGGELVSVVDGGYLELDGLDALDEVFSPGCYLVLFGGVVWECLEDSWERMVQRSVSE